MEQKTRGFIPYLPFFIPEAKNCEELAKEGVFVTDLGMASTPAMFMTTVEMGWN